MASSPFHCWMSSYQTVATFFNLLIGTVSPGNITSQSEFIDFANVANGDTLITEDGRGSFTVSYDSSLHPTGGSSAITLRDFQLFTGDFDEDGDVDGADFLTWQRSFGLDDGGDADFDGDTDENDLLIWQAGYGQPAALASASAVVPEPTSVLMLCIGFIGAALGRRRS